VVVTSDYLLHLPMLYAAPQTETIINGAQHPELIPDERAYHMVLLIASASERSTSLAHRRAHAVVVNFPMSNQDQVAFGNLAQQVPKIPGANSRRAARYPVPVQREMESGRSPLV